MLLKSGGTPGDNAAHNNDVMEDPYNFPSIWCTQVGYNDKGLVSGNAGKFD